MTVRTERFSALHVLSLVMGSVVFLGLAETLLAPRGGGVRINPPTAAAFAVFAVHLALAGRPGLARKCAAGATALIGAVSLLSLLDAPLSGHLDPGPGNIDAPGQRVGAQIPLTAQLLGGLGALALLSRAIVPALALLATLALILRAKIAVLETVLTGAGHIGLSIWTVICAWCLVFALIFLLRDKTLFSCVFMPGRPGKVMRWMAGATVLVPIIGVGFLRLTGGMAADQGQIAELCGLLGWVMLVIALAFGTYLQTIIEQLEETGRRDPLTRLLNRNGLAEELQRARTRFRGVILCDLDRFKAINDRYGHEQGDRVLRGVADALTAALAREDAVLARWGGEEFLILLPEEREAALRDIAEGCRAAIASLPDSVLCGMPGQAASASFGCAALPGGEHGLERALQDADRSLYAAKMSGRNRVVVSLV